MRVMLAALIVGGMLAGGSSASAAAPPVATPLTAVDAKATIDKYCVTCHNDRMKTAGLSLAKVDFANLGASAAPLEKVIRKLHAASMPPVGSPRPEKGVYKSLAGFFERELDAAATARPNAGRTEGLHRLNRVEYRNAIRDLLALEGMDIDQMLPTDDASYGFDNIAGVLGMSPTHLERYLSAARKISRAAVGDVTIPAYGETTMVPPDLSQDGQLDGFPVGTRGGSRVRRYFPVDGEYLIRFQTVTGYGVSEDEPNFVEATIDGERVFYEKVKQIKAVGNDDEATTTYEVRVPVKGGLRDVVVTFLETTVAQPEDILAPYQRPPSVSLFKHARLGGYAGPYVAMVSFTGPLKATGPGDTPSRRRIFVCRPTGKADEAPCARRILGTVAKRAYRRPVTAGEVDALMVFYKSGASTGGFEKGVRVALQRVLSSPDFLFRVERQPATAKVGAPYRLTDLELASRLSFFLWSSIPDDTLLNLASAGRLREPGMLNRQVKRMLADPKADALVANFGGQWMRLRNVKVALPDTRMFPDFDENLRLSFQRETELFFSSIIKEDRNAVELLSADYTFLNERLARHYGIPGIYGSEFRRVTVKDGRRGGLLGQGSILTVTSQANRTSPVVRGKWVLENLLGAPPPAPPANVPSLDATPVKGTLRQRMEQHRRNPVCASCHKVMDPLGFALENFDPTGAWRTHENGNPVDAEGSTPDGSTFQGVAGLRTALVADPSVFLNALTEKLMIYALGRGLEGYDSPAVRTVVRDAEKNGYRFSSFILGIVNSTPFQMRQADAPSPVPALTTASR